MMFLFQEVTPAVNPWLAPNVIVPVGLAAVAFVAWLVRLEYKTNSNSTRQQESEKAFSEDLKDVQAKLGEHLKSVVDEIRADRLDTREWKKEFYRHATDTKLHHNEEAFTEFRSGLDRRFNGMETTLSEMNRKLDHLNGK